jgi:hypothetical protein
MDINNNDNNSDNISTSDKPIWIFYGRILTGKEFKMFFPKLYNSCIKLTNAEENHNGFQFVTGINKDTSTFDSTKICGPTGIYFTTLDKIPNWLEYGDKTMKYCRKVSLPDDCKVTIVDRDTIKTNIIDLGERKKIKDLEIWKNDDFGAEAIFAKMRFSNMMLPNMRLGKYIQNSSENAKMIAVKKYPSIIEIFLELGINISEEIQMAAVEKEGILIKHLLKIDLPVSKKVKLEAVRQNGMAIKYLVKNKTSDKNETSYIDIDKDLQLAAVRQNGLALRYIKNPTEEIQIEAMKNNGCAISYIDNPSDDVQIEALKTGKTVALERILRKKIDISVKVQLVTMEDAAFALRATHIFKERNIIISDEVKLAAVKKCGLCIINIVDPSEEIQIEVVKGSPFLIKHINNPSETVRSAAISAQIEKDAQRKKIENDKKRKR